MHLKVAHFVLAAYFADEVNWSLYLVDMTRLVAFDDQDCAHHIGGGGDVEEEDFPIVGRGQDGWCHEEFFEFLECPGGILVLLELVEHPEKFEEG